MVAVVEFPPNGTSYLGGCPNAEYARCRRWEAQCDDLVPKAQSGKERLSCRVIHKLDGSCQQGKGKEQKDDKMRPL